MRLTRPFYATYAESQRSLKDVSCYCLSSFLIAEFDVELTHKGCQNKGLARSSPAAKTVRGHRAVPKDVAHFALVQYDKSSMEYILTRFSSLNSRILFHQASSKNILQAEVWWFRWQAVKTQGRHLLSTQGSKARLTILCNQGKRAESLC